MNGLSKTTQLDKIIALAFAGMGTTDIANTLGCTWSHVANVMNHPDAKVKLENLRRYQMEVAVEPIKARLERYADQALEKIYTLMRADAENVQLAAAREILHMAGYRPNSSKDVKEEEMPTINVQMNFYGDRENGKESNAIEAVEVVEWASVDA